MPWYTFGLKRTPPASSVPAALTAAATQVKVARDENLRPDTSMQGLAALSPSFTLYGEMGGFDAVGIQEHP